MSDEWREGLTLRVALALLFTALVLTPVTVWATLGVGPLPGGLVWVVVLLMMWMASIYGKPLTRQELYVIREAAWTVAYAAGPISFTSLIYNVWFAESPVAKLFRVEKYLPYWFAPQNPLIRQQVIRTFFHLDWLPAIGFSILFWAMNVVIGLTLGVFLYRLYVVEEKLPFPMDRVEVEVITQLEVREPMRMRTLIAGAFFGFIYSFIAYGIPVITANVLGVRIEVIPVPWIDLTRAFEKILPGAMVGISTSPIDYMLGFILPLDRHIVLIAAFATSLVVSLIGNPWVVWHYPELIPEWVNFPVGMSLTDILLWSNMYIWFSVSIGLALSVFISQLVGGWRRLARTFKGLLRVRGVEVAGILSLWKILAIYLVLTIAWLLIVSQVMIPGFPLPGLIFLIVVWPIVSGIVTTRVRGETGFWLDIPYLREGILMASMVAADIPIYSELGMYPWFTPMTPANGSGWARAFYVCDGIKLKFSSYVKAVILVATPLTILFSLLYTELVWRISPVPSSMFPYAQVYWPINAAQSSLWYTRLTHGFRPELMVYSLIAGVALWVCSSIVHMPLLIIGVAMGATALPTPLAWFIGLVLFKLLARRVGAERLRSYALMFTGGLSIGLAIAITISAGIVMVAKSIWILPY